MALNREAILSASDLRREEVKVPEWGGSVFVRTMTAFEQNAYYQRIADDKSSDMNVMLEFLCNVVCDENGNRILKEDDIDALYAKSFSAINRLLKEAMRINNLTQDAEEELEKN